MVGIPIVEVISGGIAATDTPNGVHVTVGSRGLPITWVTSGGIPLNKGGVQANALRLNGVPLLLNGSMILIRNF